MTLAQLENLQGIDEKGTRLGIKNLDFFLFLIKNDLLAIKICSLGGVYSMIASYAEI